MDIREQLRRAPMVMIDHVDAVDASYPRWALHCGGRGRDVLLAVFREGTVDLRCLKPWEHITRMDGTQRGLGSLFRHGLTRLSLAVEWVDIDMLNVRDQVTIIGFLVKRVGAWGAARHAVVARRSTAEWIGRDPEMPLLVRAACYWQMRNEAEREVIRHLVRYEEWREAPAWEDSTPFAAAVVILADLRANRDDVDREAIVHLCRNNMFDACFEREFLRERDWQREAAEAKRIAG